MEEDEGKANSSKTIDRSGNTASDSEAKQKASLRRELERRPWLLIAMIAIIADLIGWLSYLAVVPVRKELPSSPYDCRFCGDDE